MASTNLALNVKGVDKTGGVFQAIAAKAKGMGSIFGGIAAAAAGIVSVKAVADTVNELGKLSDVAMQAGSSVEDLDGLSRAFGELGVKGGGIEELARTFQYMTKTTGKAGAEGFAEVVNEVAKLGTAQERAQAAQAAFGRAGLQYLPLIEAAAQNGSTSILEMARSYATVTTAAAENGDACADAMSAVTGAISTMWRNTIGEICGMLDRQFDGGIRVAAHRAALIFSEFFKNFGNAFMEWGDFICNAAGNIATFIGETIAAAFTDGTVSGAWESFKQSMAEDWKSMEIIPESVWKDIDAKTEAYRKGIMTAAKGGIGGAEAAAAAARGGKTASSSNSWLGAGSYAAATLGIRSQIARDNPQVREQKKTNDWLKKICEKSGNDDLAVMEVGA